MRELIGLKWRQLTKSEKAELLKGYKVSTNSSQGVEQQVIEFEVGLSINSACESNTSETGDVMIQDNDILYNPNLGPIVAGPLRIKDARKRAGLTQSKMNALLDIPLPTIKAWDSNVNSTISWAEDLLVEKLNSICDENKGLKDN